MSKQKLIELKEKVEALNAELKNVYSEGLKEYASEIFVKHPNIKGFSWTQYTPYFNDGEPCEFSIHADYPSVMLATKDGDDWVDLDNVYTFKKDATGKTISYDKSNRVILEEYADIITLENRDEIIATVREFARDALYPFENQLQALLGEGRVLVTPEGVEVEDYDHD